MMRSCRRSIPVRNTCSVTRPSSPGGRLKRKVRLAGRGLLVDGGLVPGPAILSPFGVTSTRRSGTRFRAAVQTYSVDDDALLAEQRAYYRARATEYDEWWQRRGRFDRGSEMSEEWDRQVSLVAAALGTFGATGRVLELAGGTGWWTQRLARTADRLTVVDSSPETLDLNRNRVGRSDVDYVVADLFSWQPQRTYDVVFFSFWLSHVPRQRFSAFWSLVQTCLAPSGRVFVVDNRDPDRGGELDDAYVMRAGPDLDLRRLHDGSRYQVVEIFYEPDELRSLLDQEGWTAKIGATPWFIFGDAQPR